MKNKNKCLAMAPPTVRALDSLSHIPPTKQTKRKVSSPHNVK